MVECFRTGLHFGSERETGSRKSERALAKPGAWSSLILSWQAPLAGGNMRGVRLGFCAALAVALSITSVSLVFAAHLVRCESKGFKLQLCPADTRRGVELRRQLSDTDCQRGQN